MENNAISSLRFLIDQTNAGEMQDIVVVLSVHGTLIQGVLIGTEEYVDLFHSIVIKTAQGSNDRKRFVALAHDTETDSGNQIYLRDVVIRATDVDVGTRLWAGVLTSVDGFFCGTFPS